MRRYRHVLPGLLALALMACGLTKERIQPETPAAEVCVDLHASAEELFFEAVRLHSSGLMDERRWTNLLGQLAWVDEHYGRDEDHDEQLRQVLRLALLHNRRALKQAGYDDVIRAEEFRAYARTLHREGVRAAQLHAEGVILISGMLGFPTSREEAVLMVAVPVGGHVVVKLGRVALKRAAFLLRRMRTADEVLDGARKLGFSPVYTATEAELRATAGEAAVEAAKLPRAHVGASNGRGRGLHNPWNPSHRNDNCTACVASVIRNSLEGTALLSPNPPPGHYAIFTRWGGGEYQHVVYGRVTPTGRIIVFDPQSMEHMTFPELLERHGRARPHLMEAR